jgi:hypothetical protein
MGGLLIESSLCGGPAVDLREVWAICSMLPRLLPKPLFCLPQIELSAGRGGRIRTSTTY